MGELDGVNILNQGVSGNGYINFNVDGVDDMDTVLLMDELSRICLRDGNHCSSYHFLEPSVQKPKTEGTVRASLLYYNKINEVDAFSMTLKKILKDL